MEIEYIKKHKDDVKSWNHCFICFTCFTFMFCLKSTQTKKLDSHWDLMRQQRRAIETAPKDSSPTMSNFAKSKEHLESGGKTVRGCSRSFFQYLSIFTSISLSRTGMAMTYVTLFSWCTDLRKSMLKFHCQSVDSERSLSPFHVAMWEGGGRADN